ncbi:hypothetical protein COCOBI_02-8490 [Coccomyxa sp. Obi]|nr:hypothetical protein COCOBI_02-8490 [Coccomyxa sp. Obi]
MAEADPRSFWQRFKRQDRTEGNISVEHWHDFFSDLLSCPPGEPEAAAETLQPHHRGYSSGDVHTTAASANEPATPHPLDVDITADEVLQETGVSPKMLHCLQSMHAADSARVFTTAGLTDTFPCTMGVKQGCPLSPLLFGIYLDGLQKILEAF